MSGDEFLLDLNFILGKYGDLAIPLDKPNLRVIIYIIEALKRF